MIVPAWRRVPAAQAAAGVSDSGPVEEDAPDHDAGLQRLVTSIIFLTFSRLASSRKAEKSIMKPPPLPHTPTSLSQ